MDRISLFTSGIKSVFFNPAKINPNITFSGRIKWHMWKLQCFLYYWIPKPIWRVIFYKNNKPRF